MKPCLSEARKKELFNFLHSIKLHLNDYVLLNTALTHSSFIKDQAYSKNQCNERLEFFGDAVLKLIISEYLMENFPAFNEGELSKFRAYLVSDRVLSEIAIKLGVKKYILIGKNERRSTPKSILPDCLEAILAVIYYECGLKKVRDFIICNFKDYLNLASINASFYNYKAILQEYTQDKKLGLPDYKTINESGPEHNKEFEVAVVLNDNILATGKGMSKKEASQDAAKNALCKMKVLK